MAYMTNRSNLRAKRESVAKRRIDSARAKAAKKTDAANRANVQYAAQIEADRKFSLGYNYGDERTGKGHDVAARKHNPEFNWGGNPTRIINPKTKIQYGLAY